MDSGPFESHIADLPVMPSGLTPAELIFATTKPKEVTGLYNASLAYTHDLYRQYKQAVADVHQVDHTYFGHVEELSGPAATAVSDRLVAAVRAEEKVDADYLNALHGYDAQTASIRYMETGSQGDDYLDAITEAEAKVSLLGQAVQEEGDLQSAIAAAQDLPNKLRSGAVMIGGFSVLVAAQGGIGMSILQESHEAATLTAAGKESAMNDADVWSVVGGVGLTGVLLAGTLLAKARSLPHWRARRKLKRLRASDPYSNV